MKQIVSLSATAFIVMVLLFSLVELLTVNSANAGLFESEGAPAGYRIYSNGTFNVPNLQRAGNVYTFIGNVDGTIVIESNDVVLDGAGYTLGGQNGSTGIWLQDKNEVIIKNLNVKNFGTGIRFSHYTPEMYSGETNTLRTTNCTIQNCTITHNEAGISLDYTVNCNVLSNYVADNTQGIILMGEGNIFRNNRIDHNRYDFWENCDEDNDIDESNTINGKPIIYWVNKHDLTVPSNAGLVILKQCEGIVVKNLKLTGHGVGLTLYYTNNSEITGNNISDNYWRGIKIWWSNNNSIVGNHITSNNRPGIENYEATNNTISHNLIKDNKGYGIYDRASISNHIVSSNQIINNEQTAIFGDSNNCTITDNYVIENSGGISVNSNCIIARNNVTSNKANGISFRDNCTVTNNFISKNKFHGIITNDALGNIIAENTVLKNDMEGLWFHFLAKNNLIYHNNFIENNNNGIQAVVNDHFNPPEHNEWDNGSEGNYWSNYIFAGQQNGDSRVGNTTYSIAVNNQDRYPLLNPVDFEALEVPTVPNLTLTNIADPTPTPTDTPTATPTPNQTPIQTGDPSQTTKELDTDQTQADSILPIVAIAVVVIAIAATGLLLFLKKSNRI